MTVSKKDIRFASVIMEAQDVFPTNKVITIENLKTILRQKQKPLEHDKSIATEFYLLGWNKLLNELLQGLE